MPSSRVRLDRARPLHTVHVLNSTARRYVTAVFWFLRWARSLDPPRSVRTIAEFDFLLADYVLHLWSALGPLYKVEHTIYGIKLALPGWYPAWASREL